MKICNHQLRSNNQLKHYAVDERGVRVREDCTFCSLDNAPPRPAESYTHFFLDCDHSMNILRPVATKFNIPLPNLSTKGELVLYYFPWKGYWDELRINIFFAIFKYYLLMCRTRKMLPNSIHFETDLRTEWKNIVMTNPTNKNLLPLWTGRELTETETLELLEDVKGKTDKGKLFKYSNKNNHCLKNKCPQ